MAQTDPNHDKRDDAADESIATEPRPEQPPMTDADGLPHNTDTEDET